MPVQTDAPTVVVDHALPASAHRARPARRGRTGPTIRVGTGVGSGPTRLAAFDRALGRAGVGSYNLVRVGAKIPAGSTIVPGARFPEARWGDRLYAVWAHAEADPGQEAWAALAWARDESTGRGLFAWHAASSQDEARRDAEASLRAMVAGRGELFGPVEFAVAGGRAGPEPLSAVAVATFGSASWE